VKLLSCNYKNNDLGGMVEKILIIEYIQQYCYALLKISSEVNGNNSRTDKTGGRKYKPNKTLRKKIYLLKNNKTKKLNTFYNTQTNNILYGCWIF
jgi:hypothetical protein